MTETEYQKAIEELYVKFPSFQNTGGAAYKPGLDNFYGIDSALGSPSSRLRCVHIAGTNGKGSVSHMIASALMQVPKYFATGLQAGRPSGEKMKVGLYTSPHLTDFRERIKVDGKMVPKEWVFGFLQKNNALFEERHASFFEITTAMAFCYFTQQQVDIAVIECGLGGRLDSTNVIHPLVSVITNIGLDHCQYLGNTLEEIAAEKAGIIKSGVPVVIGESDGEGVGKVFEETAATAGSPIFFAERLNRYNPFSLSRQTEFRNAADADASLKSISSLATCIYSSVGIDEMDLKGDCQQKNIKTVSCATALVLRKLSEATTIDISEPLLAGIFFGIENAARLTGLRGRWEILQQEPLVICDIGHNAHGMKTLCPQLRRSAAGHRKFYFIFGVMRDKDLAAEYGYLPEEAEYLYVNARGSRALPAGELAAKMTEAGFTGKAVEQGTFSSVEEAVHMAIAEADNDDFIFIGGSSYVVAEALGCFGCPPGIR